MKKKYRKSIFIPLVSLAILFGLTQNTFAQRVVPVDEGAGTLNQAIASDTTATGERVDPNTVYELARGGTYITWGSIENSDFHLTIQAADGVGDRPIIQPGIPDGGDGSSRPFRPRGDLTLKGLSITNLDQLGGLNTRIIRISADNVKIELDDCWLNQDGQSAFRFDNPGIKLFITNSVISNIGSPSDPNNGRGIDDRGNDVDSLVIENTTFYNLTSTILRDGGGIINYVKFNQNTVINTGQRTLDLGEVIKAEVTNNLMINNAFYGGLATDTGNRIILLDSIGQDLIDAGKTQEITISNNNFFTDQSLLDAQGTDIIAATTFDTGAQAFVDDSGLGDSNISEDVPFATPPAIPVEILTGFYGIDPDNTPDWKDKTTVFDFAYPDNKLSATASQSDAQLGGVSWELSITGITVLQSAVDMANNELTEAVTGSNIGKYPADAVTALTTETAAAQVVVDNTSATKAEITTALTDLNAALTAFQSTLIDGTQRVVPVDEGAGTLNQAIASDTTATGERVDPNTVYELARGGTYITWGSVENRDFHLTIRAAGGDGARPIIQPGIPDGGDGSSRPFRPRGDLTLKSLSITNLDQLGGLNTRIVRISADNVKIELDDCWLNQDGQSAFRFDNPGIKLFITNSVISNIGSPSDPNNGRGIDDRGNDVDSLVIENSTFYNLTSTILRDGGGIINYVKFNQNTVVNTGQRTLDLGEVIKAEVTNNLMINNAFYGSLETDTGNRIILLDSIGQDLIDAGKTQEITISNNNFFTDQSLLDAQGTDIVAATTFDTGAQAFVDDSGLGDSNISEDVQFATPPAIPVDILTGFYGADPDNTPDWKDKTTVFDFGYRDNYLSATASNSDAQLGDLSWELSETGITGLKSAVVTANEELDGAVAGGNIGNHPTEAVTALTTATAAAQAVVDNTSATEAEITTALTDLNAAITAFQSTLITGDIDTQTLEDGFSFFPNPGTNLVKVESNSNSRIENLELYSSNGQVIKRLQQVDAKSIDLDISTLERGIYLLKIYQNDGNQFSGRVVKK